MVAVGNVSSVSSETTFTREGVSFFPSTTHNRSDASIGLVTSMLRTYSSVNSVSASSCPNTLLSRRRCSSSRIIPARSMNRCRLLLRRRRRLRPFRASLLCSLRLTKSKCRLRSIYQVGAKINNMAVPKQKTPRKYPSHVVGPPGVVVGVISVVLVVLLSPPKLFALSRSQKVLPFQFCMRFHSGSEIPLSVELVSFPPPTCCVVLLFGRVLFA
mmetsp:Transcript_34168/g.82829  ORF Transcript_34168/g.82829 Transcript_34168/m.82829 type:complete len:214 (+) Transcript_34168:1265-1906(+)